MDMDMDLNTDKMIARKANGVGWMTFNNPDRLNAVSLEMWQAISEIIQDFHADDAVRAVVMTGAGGKSFASGADISEFEKHRSSAEAEEEYGRISNEARHALAAFDKPLIAMIQGYCIGGGLALALTADIRIASEDSQYAIPAARLGLGYGLSGLKTLSDIVGPALAKDILFTARRLSAAEALRIGLVNMVVPRWTLKQTVDEYVATIAENAPLTIQAAKAAINEALKDPDDRDMAAIDAKVRACFDSEDYIEGRRAFMEKRRPVFQGR